jgi:hypothetical protein
MLRRGCRETSVRRLETGELGKICQESGLEFDGFRAILSFFASSRTVSHDVSAVTFD